MSRPSTSSGGNHHGTEIEEGFSREIQLSRPSTSSGRRHLSSSSIDTGGSSGLFADRSTNISQEILMREADQDSLIRIMNYSKIQLENEAMIVASETGDVHKFRELVNQGLNISECRGLHGYSLLHHAAQKGHNLIIAEMLRSQRVSPDVTNNALETPLHLAAYSGQILTVDQLLDFGANVNAVNEDSETCLFYAARKNFPAIIRLLIQRGIDVNHVDRYGDRAIDHTSNPLTIKALESGMPLSFPSSSLNKAEKMTSDNLFLVFSYLTLQELFRAACVNSKWHRVSEHPSIWKERGVRKWELALRNSLGFGRPASASFLRPPVIRRSSSGGNSSSKFRISNSEK